MTKVIPFSFESFSVRTLVINDQPWFVAADVCSVLGLKNVTMALRYLDDDESALSNVEGRSESGVEQSREVNIINESGLYALILRSRKPTAKRFRKWITSEVIPSIRKNGTYRAIPSIAERSWIWNVDHHGKEFLRPIPHNALIMSIPELLKAVAEPGGLVINNDELVGLAFAAMSRLINRRAK